MGNRFLVEVDLCTGCMICAQVCSLIRSRTCNPVRARIRIIDWEHSGQSVPIVCQDCAEPVCVPSCPAGAIRQDLNSGRVTIDKTLCTNCRTCIRVCPYGGPIWDPVERQVLLCDHCGGRPPCVPACPTGALGYGSDGGAGEDPRGVRQRGLAEIRKSLVRLAGV